MVELAVRIFRSFSRKERLWFLGALCGALLVSPILFFHFIDTTTIVAPSFGGSYTEGMVGQLSFVNPVLARPGTPDSDITSLVFASVADIAESIKYNRNFTVWNVRLKEGAQWHDKTPITSDDIIFTVRTIQNQDTLSPLAGDWGQIEAYRVSEREIEFKIPSPYAFFPSLLDNLRPIPKKIFADIDPANIKLSAYNLEPIGSGPYQYQENSKRKDGFITSYTLAKAESYATIAQEPYIKTITFSFFENTSLLLAAYNKGTIDGFGTFENINNSLLSIKSSVRSIPSGKYYALFFNQQAREVLGNVAVRDALAMGINRDDIINNVFDGNADAEYGPIPPAILKQHTIEDEQLQPTFDPAQAKTLLANDGWIWNTDASVWEKRNKKGDTTETLSFTIKTADASPLKDIASVIQQNWQTIGVPVTIVTIDPATIQEEVIQPRNYELLLFGNIVAQHLDLFSFWHSSQKFDPGLNLSLYQNSAVDQAIINLRSTDQGDQANSLFERIQKTVAYDTPAVFLVSPHYLYITTESIPGITIPFVSLPTNRFATITSWYVKTHRALK